MSGFARAAVVALVCLLPLTGPAFGWYAWYPADTCDGTYPAVEYVPAPVYRDRDVHGRPAVPGGSGCRHETCPPSKRAQAVRIARRTNTLVISLLYSADPCRSSVDRRGCPLKKSHWKRTRRPSFASGSNRTDNDWIYGGRRCCGSRLLPTGTRHNGMPYCRSII